MAAVPFSECRNQAAVIGIIQYRRLAAGRQLVLA
jgi:hypothetical protein